MSSSVRFAFIHVELLSLYILKAGNFLQSFKTSPLVRQIKWFKDMREGCVPSTYTLNGSFKIQETMFLRQKKNKNLLVMEKTAVVRKEKGTSPLSECQVSTVIKP